MWVRLWVKLWVWLWSRVTVGVRFFLPRERGAMDEESVLRHVALVEEEAERQRDLTWMLGRVLPSPHYTNDSLRDIISLLHTHAPAWFSPESIASLECVIGTATCTWRKYTRRWRLDRPQQGEYLLTVLEPLNDITAWATRPITPLLPASVFSHASAAPLNHTTPFLRFGHSFGTTIRSFIHTILCRLVWCAYTALGYLHTLTSPFLDHAAFSLLYDDAIPRLMGALRQWVGLPFARETCPVFFSILAILCKEDGLCSSLCPCTPTVSMRSPSFPPPRAVRFLRKRSSSISPAQQHAAHAPIR